MITQGQIQEAKAKLKEVANSLTSDSMSADAAMEEARKRLPDEAQLESVEAQLFPEPEPVKPAKVHKETHKEAHAETEHVKKHK